MTTALPRARVALPLVFAVVALAGCAPAADPSPSEAAPAASAPLTASEQLIAAIDADDLDAVVALIDGGVDPSAPIGTGGLTPLHRAAGGDHAVIVAALIDAGADPDAKAAGLTPLMLAASSAGAATIQALADGGADLTVPNPKNYGAQAIHYAARDANVEALEALVAAGASIDSLDSTRTTPISYGAYFGRYDVVAACLDLGADPNIADSWGSTATQWAYTNGFTEIGDMLAAAGGV